MKSTLLAKKRPSPSTQRRNARRREKFLKKKLGFESISPLGSDSAADTSSASTPISGASLSPPSTSHSPSPTPTSPYFVKCRSRGGCDQGRDKKYFSESDLMAHMAVEHNGNLCVVCQVDPFYSGKPLESCKCEEPHSLMEHWSHCLPRGSRYCAVELTP